MGSSHVFILAQTTLENFFEKEFSCESPRAYIKRLINSFQFRLEVRVPFLDHKFMEFTATISPWHKMNMFRRKFALKKALAGSIPKEVIEGKKKGFASPVDVWLKGELKGQLHEILKANRGYFNQDFIEKLWKQHQAGTFNHQQRLWGLISFELWNRIFIDNIKISKVLTS